MKKANFLILLVIISLTFCSREEEKTTGINTYGLVDFSKKDDNITKQLIIHSYETDIYNHIDEKYKRYIEGHNMNYKKYNKNGEHLIFPFHNVNEIVDDQHIVIFKYYDNILITFYDYNITNDYYIDLKNMYYFVSLEENKKIKELFEKTPMEYRCKVSRNDDYTIKFYDENCEKRIKEMLKMDNINKTENKEQDLKKFKQEIYNSIEKKYLYYIDTAGQWNLPEFNKNGKLLLFEINAQYNFESGYYRNDEYIKMLKYDNKIIVKKFNIDPGIYYINMDYMYFLPDIEQDKVANDIANRSKTSMFCKISIQDDNKIKFYDKICEKRIKEMLKMDFQK